MRTDEKFVITINREIGSGGCTIGRKLAEKLGVKFYNKTVLQKLVEHFELSPEQIDRIKARKKNWWTELSELVATGMAPGFSDKLSEVTSRDLFEKESEIIREITDAESCVIAGRSGFFILKDHPNKLSVYVHAPLQKRVARVMRKQNLSEEEARALIARIDEGRDNYTKAFTGSSRYDVHNYDLVLNTDKIDEDEAVETILALIPKTVD